MKKIISTIFAFILLASCSSASLSGDDNPTFYTYETSNYQIDIPDTWEVITDFDSSYTDGIEIAFKNNIKDQKFIANVSIIHERDDESFTNADISQEKLKDNSASLINYNLDSQSEINLNIGGSEATTFLNIFSGKNKSDGYTFNFMQTYLTKGNDIWVVTATNLTDEDEFVVERMEKMLTTFALK